MSVISLTFHSPNHLNEQWENYLQTELRLMAENLFDVEKFMLADVDSGMIAEGRNTNLLLFFENDEKREDFLGIELQNIFDRITAKFGDEVLLFDTKLNPRFSNL